MDRSTRRQGERGALSIEYVGIVIIIVVLVVALLNSRVADTLRSVFENQIEQVTEFGS